MHLCSCGLQTSRPSGTTPSIDSPYAPDFASDIAQSLCEQHNIQHVIFVGQADGSAIAVLAAAKTQRSVVPFAFEGAALVSYSYG